MNTRVRRKPLGELGEPHQNARKVYEHVERYLAGACNEEALEAWRLAVGKGLERGWPLDGILKHACELFLKDGRGQRSARPWCAAPGSDGPASGCVREART